MFKIRMFSFFPDAKYITLSVPIGKNDTFS
jgi:hypothetical protein